MQIATTKLKTWNLGAQGSEVAGHCEADDVVLVAFSAARWLPDWNHDWMLACMLEEPNGSVRLITRSPQSGQNKSQPRASSSQDFLRASNGKTKAWSYPSQRSKAAASTIPQNMLLVKRFGPILACRRHPHGNARSLVWTRHGAVPLFTLLYEGGSRVKSYQKGSQRATPAIN